MRLGDFVYADFYRVLNLGDDLFLKVLLERYPNKKFLIYDIANYKQIFRDYENAVFLHPLSWRMVSAFARKFHLKRYTINNILASRCRMAVVIGGSIFDGLQMLEYRNDLISKKDCFILGANFGRNTDSRLEESYRTFFKTKKDVCFRDCASYNLFSQLPNVRVAPDILWSLKMPYVEGKGLFVSVMCLERAHPELIQFQKMYNEVLTRVIRDWILRSERVILGSFCMKEGDEIGIQNILNGLTAQERCFVEVHYYRGDIESMLNIINSCEMVLATRFHSVVLGLLMEKKVIPICYSNKTENLLDDIGLEDKKNLISELRYDNLKECNLSRKKIEHLRKESEMQFQVLDVCLKRHN